MVTGVNAKIKFDNKEAVYITNWSVDMQTNLADILVLGTSDKTSLPMGQSWSASADGLIMRATNDIDAEKPSATLITRLTEAYNSGTVMAIDFELANNKLSGNALIESLSFEASAGEIPKVSISISGSGALTLNSTLAQ